VNSKNSKKISEAVELLRAGDVLAVATDTVYGLICDPRNQAAVDKIFTLKGRDFTKPLQVLVADSVQARELIEIPEHAEELTREWPGPLTLVAKARVQLANRVGKNNTIGVRVPDAPTIVALLKQFGPLAATSANPSGQPPATTAAQVRGYFDEGFIPLVLGEDAEISVGTASRVVDVTAYPHVVLRQATKPNAGTTRS